MKLDIYRSFWHHSPKTFLCQIIACIFVFANFSLFHQFFVGILITLMKLDNCHLGPNYHLRSLECQTHCVNNGGFRTCFCFCQRCAQNLILESHKICREHRDYISMVVTPLAQAPILRTVYKYSFAKILIVFISFLRNSSPMKQFYLFLQINNEKFGAIEKVCKYK